MAVSFATRVVSRKQVLSRCAFYHVSEGMLRVVPPAADGVVRWECDEAQSGWSLRGSSVESGGGGVPAAEAWRSRSAPRWRVLMLRCF